MKNELGLGSGDVCDEIDYLQWGKKDNKYNGKMFKKLESLKNSYLRNVKISPEISKQIFGTHQLKFSNIGV